MSKRSYIGTNPLTPPTVASVREVEVSPEKTEWRLVEKIEKIEVLNGAVALLAVLCTAFMLLSMDSIVHQLLYQYGLQFSYEWANPYWLYLRTSLVLMLVTTIAIMALLYVVRHQRIRPVVGIEEKPILLHKIGIEEELQKLEPKMRMEKELILLRNRLWRLRGRRIRMSGIALLIVSGVFLSLAYSTRYIVFEVTSIIALFLGVIFVFAGVEPHVKTRVADRAVMSSLIPLSSFLNYLEVNGKAIHIPPTSGQGSGKIFIAAKGKSTLPTFEEITKHDDIIVLKKGVLLPSIGNALLQLYEEELGDLRNIDLNYLMGWLSQVLVDGLRISEKMETIQKGDEIHVKLTLPVFRYVCQRKEAAKLVCETTGCPLCSSIAEAIAKTTGQIVYFLDCSYDLTTRKTTALYRLGESWKPRKKK